MDGWLRMRLTAMVCRARLSWRSPSRLSRCRSVRPEDTGTGAVPEQHRERGFGGDPAGVRPGQQDLRGAVRAGAGPGRDEARGHVLDDLGDLLFQLGGGAGELGDPLAEPDQGLVQYPGLAVSAGRPG